MTVHALLRRAAGVALGIALLQSGSARADACEWHHYQAHADEPAGYATNCACPQSPICRPATAAETDELRAVVQKLRDLLTPPAALRLTLKKERFTRQAHDVGRPGYFFLEEYTVKDSEPRKPTDCKGFSGGACEPERYVTGYSATYASADASSKTVWFGFNIRAALCEPAPPDRGRIVRQSGIETTYDASEQGRNTEHIVIFKAGGLPAKCPLAAYDWSYLRKAFPSGKVSGPPPSARERVNYIALRVGGDGELVHKFEDALDHGAIAAMLGK